MHCLVKFSLCQTKNVNVIKKGKVWQLVKSAARCDKVNIYVWYGDGVGVVLLESAELEESVVKV